MRRKQYHPTVSGPLSAPDFVLVDDVKHDWFLRRWRFKRRAQPGKYRWPSDDPEFKNLTRKQVSVRSWRWSVGIWW